MKKDFTEVMSQRSDKQLVEILTFKRGEYTEEALAAAEAELNKRNLSISDIISEEELHNAQEKYTNPPIEEQRLPWYYKIIVFFQILILTFIIKFLSLVVFHSPLLNISSIPINLLVQVLIFRELKNRGFTRMALDFKVWVLNAWILCVALYIVVTLLEFYFNHS